MIPGFMVQLGIPTPKDPAKEAEYGQGDPGYKIAAEFNSRKHERGVLSMASGGDPMERSGNMPRPSSPTQPAASSSRRFGPATSLDGRYTTFGKSSKARPHWPKIEKIPVERNPYSGENSKPKIPHRRRKSTNIVP